MAGIHDEQRQQAGIVVCQTAAAADFVVATLAANGVAAHAAYGRGPFPSVDWAEGYRVTVASDAEEEARRVLGALSDRDDVAPLDGPDARTPPPEHPRRGNTSRPSGAAGKEP